MWGKIPCPRFGGITIITSFDVHNICILLEETYEMIGPQGPTPHHHPSYTRDDESEKSNGLGVVVVVEGGKCC